MEENTTPPEALTELPAVARNISLPCKKCGLERFHVVVAHTTSTSAKVKCEVCGSTKTFKLAKAKKPVTPKPKSARTQAAEKKAAAESQAYLDLYNKLKEEIGTSGAQPYNMKATFNIASAVTHPNFGLGFVTKATPDRIDVAFESGGKSLVHNRK